MRVVARPPTHRMSPHWCPLYLFNLPSPTAFVMPKMFDRHHDLLVSFDCDIDQNTCGTVRLIVMGGTVDMSVVQLECVWCS